jgi:hypothetical protein
VGPTKEWKPKPTNQNVVPNPGIIGTSTVSNSMFEVSRSPSPDENSTLDDTSSKLDDHEGILIVCLGALAYILFC